MAAWLGWGCLSRLLQVSLVSEAVWLNQCHWVLMPCTVLRRVFGPDVITDRVRLHYHLLWAFFCLFSVLSLFPFPCFLGALGTLAGSPNCTLPCCVVPALEFTFLLRLATDRLQVAFVN